jgi:hypothetical protein
MRESGSRLRSTLRGLKEGLQQSYVLQTKRPDWESTGKHAHDSPNFIVPLPPTEHKSCESPLVIDLLQWWQDPILLLGSQRIVEGPSISGS